MTQVITRYFNTAEQARAAQRTLLEERVPRSAMQIFETAGGVADTLTGENVNADAAKAYEARLADGGAVLLIKAGYQPLGVAKLTRQTVAQMGAADMGDIVEEVYIKDKPGNVSSVMTEHPLFLTRQREFGSTNYHMANWPIPLISHRKPYTESVIPRHGRMANFPLPLITRHKPRDAFAFPRHARMAKLILPLTIRRKPADRFAFPRHARMANFPIPLISRRKPFTGSLIAQHARMANWPFPHLINGKPNTNSLIPGAPRMANFPIPLLSSRKPFTGSIFGRHARMANFPLPLLSKRKPFTGSIFSKHARMADMILPLTIRRDPMAGRGGFSFSRLIGMPTLSRR